MNSIFSARWEDLSLEHVREFVTLAGDEGVTWEAKSDGALAEKADALRPDSIAKAACALANQLGGYIIIGAERRTKRTPWELPGARIPGDEPDLWIGQAVRSLAPTPRHDIKVWPASDDAHRRIAVVEIQPLTRTPCLTRDGRVFERVTGASVPVTDPVRLHELIERGRNARTLAEANVRQRLVRATPDLSAQLSTPGIHIALGFAATSHTPGVRRRLFTTTFSRLLERRFAERLFEQPNLAWTIAPTTEIRQTTVTRHALGDVVQRWIASADWDGTALIRGWLAAAAADNTGIFPVMIEPAWNLAVDLVQALGGYGDAYLQLDLAIRYATPTEGSFYARLPMDTTVSRWTNLIQPDGLALDDIRRELDRAAGYWVLDDHLVGHEDPPL